MKRIEQLVATVIAIGILMKLLLISGGASVLGISLTVLAAIYYPFGFFFFNSIPIGKFLQKESYIGITAMRYVGTIGGGLIFSILSIGILFKLLQLPGASAMLTVGLFTGAAFLAIILFKYFKNKENAFIRIMAIRTIILVSLSAILYLIPGLTLVKVFYRDNPEYIKAYEQAAINPNDRDLQLKAEEAREKANH